MNSAINTVCEPPSAEDFLDIVDTALAPLSRRLPASVSREDLAGAGRFALVETLADFVGTEEEARAYAYTRVRGAMLDELRRQDPLSRRSRARVTEVRRTAGVLTQRFGRAPTAPEIAEAAGLSIEEVRSAERLGLAAEAYVADEAEDDVFNRLSDEDGVSPIDFAESEELVTLVHEALDRLAANHAFVVRRYFLEDATLEEIASEIGVSKERVRQIREAGVKKLRSDYAILGLWQALLAQRAN